MLMKKLSAPFLQPALFPSPFLLCMFWCHFTLKSQTRGQGEIDLKHWMRVCPGAWQETLTAVLNSMKPAHRRCQQWAVWVWGLWRPCPAQVLQQLAACCSGRQIFWRPRAALTYTYQGPLCGTSNVFSTSAAGADLLRGAADLINSIMALAALET